MRISKSLLLKIFIASRLIRKKRKERVRSLYIRHIFRNRLWEGELSLVKELSDDAHYHHRYFRMKKENFEFIMNKISHRLIHGQNHLRPISALERLAVTLRYLATGNSQASLAMNFRISPSSISFILREVMEAICEEMEEENLAVPDQTGWHNIKSGFEKDWNFPMCYGSIDGKHVRVKAPPHTGTQNYNYKGFFSIILLAVVDSSYKFTLVDIGASGSNSDGGVFKNSLLGQNFEAKKYEFSENQQLPTGEIVPPVILGDDGFPLKPFLMKPYPSKSGVYEENIFNYCLSRARMVVENTFGLWSARWRIFHTAIEGDCKLAKLIVRTTIILHNFLMKQKDTNELTNDRVENGVVVNGSWRDAVQGDTGIEELQRQGSNNPDRDGFKIRDRFKNYFISEEGSVPWQRDYVMRGYE